MKTKKVPEWNADLAARVRDGMSLEALEAEIVSAIEGDSKNNRENARNDALAQALLDTTSINILPESLVEETTQMRFQTMLVDFKEQGSTQEQLEEMCVALLRLAPSAPCYSRRATHPSFHPFTMHCSPCQCTLLTLSPLVFTPSRARVGCQGDAGEVPQVQGDLAAQRAQDRQAGHGLPGHRREGKDQRQPHRGE